LRFRSLGALAATLLLAACATATTKPNVSIAPPPPAAPHHAPDRAAPTGPSQADIRSLRGWRDDNHVAAFTAFRQTCGTSRDAAAAEVCRRARAIEMVDDARARAFFEANFHAEPVGDEGVLTAYYAPEYPARSQPDAEFSAPVRAKPSDLVVVDAGVFDPALAGGPGAARDVAGVMTPYPDRAAIEAEPAEKVLAWMRPEELFFLQIQGSGVLTFENGARVKANYAANNGRRFAGVANAMRDRGLLPAANTSGDAIRNWLAAHRGPEADAVMQLNPRYVFFSLAPDDGREPVGAAGVPLPAGRAIAVDPTRHAMGELFWLDAAAPTLAGAFPAYRRLALALDTGGAIKGPVRADLYMGLGPDAGAEAGRVRHVLRMYRLVPRVGPQS
jgi:membrane-bound lytic murein transglycosylase A